MNCAHLFQNWDFGAAPVAKTVANVVSAFGASVKSKLSSVAISGAPEDQLRGPLDILVRDLAEIGGLPVKTVHLVGETTLAHLMTQRGQPRSSLGDRRASHSIAPFSRR
jgi:hypothetical protein